MLLLDALLIHVHEYGWCKLFSSDFLFTAWLLHKLQEKKPHSFPYGCLSGKTCYYNFQFSTYCCVHPKDLYPSHVFIGCTDFFGFDAVFSIKKNFIFWCPDGGGRRFYNRVCRNQWSSSKQPHYVFKKKSCLTHRTIFYFALSIRTQPEWHIVIYTHQINNQESWTLQEALIEASYCLKHRNFPP